MAYSEELADLIRVQLKTDKPIEEKQMMGGLTFMVDGKMCVGIIKDDLMVRVDKERNDDFLAEPHARQMDFTHRPMKGYILIDKAGWGDPERLRKWIGLALDFNDRAKSSKPKK